ncbi:MAG: hypothetical protein EOO17_00670 [Chloroflexi bacterium]|nr:MAG: hypothetical protein EOO17_00670 [Chloroflexota bacterium]
MDWAQILVIILSVFLAIFLLLGIILAIMLIKLTKEIKQVTDSAKRTAGGIESIVSGVSRFSSPGFALGMIAKHVKKLKNKRRK